MRVVYQFSEARQKMSQIVTQVEKGGLAVIQRRGATVMLATVEEQDALLSGCYSFAPQVHFSPGIVEIWLPELEVHGEGATLSEAEDDLVDAAEEYADEWEDRLSHAPDHDARLGWVRRVQLAQAQGRTRELLFSS